MFDKIIETLKRVGGLFLLSFITFLGYKYVRNASKLSKLEDEVARDRADKVTEKQEEKQRELEKQTADEQKKVDSDTDDLNTALAKLEQLRKNRPE